MRKIKVICSKFGIKTVETDVTEWGELKVLLNEQGFQTNKDEADVVESVNKTSLQNPEAKLPEGDFKLFIRPVKNKLGGVDYSTLSYLEIKAKIKENPEVKDFLKETYGKNWTILPKDLLKEGLQTFFAKKEVVLEKVPEQTIVVKKESSQKEEYVEEVEEISLLFKMQMASEGLQEFIDEGNTEVYLESKDLDLDLEYLVQDLNHFIDFLKQEEASEEIDNEENKEDWEEFNDIFRGF